MVLWDISRNFSLLFPSRRQIIYVLLTRPPLKTFGEIQNLMNLHLSFGESFSFDLHVLNAPPAFILSQDQTLVWNFLDSRFNSRIYLHKFNWRLHSRTTFYGLYLALFIFQCAVIFLMVRERFYYSTKSNILSTHFLKILKYFFSVFYATFSTLF